MKRRADAESDRQRRLAWDSDDEASQGALAQYHSWVPVHALTALRYTSHPDPYSAAVGSLAATLSTYSSVRLERGSTFVQDERGRRHEGIAPATRSTAFLAVLHRVLAAEPDRWMELAGQLPAPLSAAELAAAADRDRRLQEAGVFQTWQLLPSASSDDGEEPHERWEDKEARYLERAMGHCRELEQRDAAVAARGMSEAEVLPPQSPGGFSVVLPDGLRIERLPAGRAAGRLWLTFVFTNELGPDPRDRLGHTHPHDRVIYTGPSGPIPRPGGGGTGGERIQTWPVHLDLDGLSWLRLGYLDGGRTVATETIDRPQLSVSSSDRGGRPVSRSTSPVTSATEPSRIAV